MTLSKRAKASASKGSLVHKDVQGEPQPSPSKGWFVYLLECADNTYYAGVAPDLDQRLKKHNSGRGAKYTRGRRPVRLAWSQGCGSYAEARALEAQLKGWGREKKRQLVAGSLIFPQRK